MRQLPKGALMSDASTWPPQSASFDLRSRALTLLCNLTMHTTLGQSPFHNLDEIEWQMVRHQTLEAGYALRKSWQDGGS